MSEPRPSPEDNGRGDIGLVTAVSLVVGNMIGSGVFLLPASLALYGGLSLVGWLVSAAGSVALALVFSRLARVSAAQGGPYAYARRAFGDLPGFLVAWSYWISVWSALAALAVAFVGYLDPFAPAIVRDPLHAGLLAIGVVWLVVYINSRGVREAGRVQVLTTALKIVPLVVIGVAGIATLQPAHFAIPDTAGPPVAGVMAVVTLTLWAFLGLETATIPAGSVREASRTIPRATIIGTLVAAVIYVISTSGVMGVIDPARLSQSSAPFADAASVLFGGAAARLVALGAAISCFGALNGWTLMAGQLPMAVAKDGLFPPIFARLSARGVPLPAMVIGGALATALIASNYSRNLVALFTFIILLSTLGTLVPYLVCSLAAVLKRPGTASAEAPARAGGGAIAAFALGYSVLAIIGAGAQALWLGGLALVVGLPVFFWLQARRPTRR